MLKADLHVHTLASNDAINTVYELAEEAKRKGVEMIGICEHSPGGVGSPSILHFISTSRRKRRNLNGVEVIWGIEVDILNKKGRLNPQDEVLEEQDLVLASFHPKIDLETGEKQSHFDAADGMINAMRNPLVDVLAHPYLVTKEQEIRRIVKAAVKFRVPLEINNSHLVPPRDVDFYYPKVLLMVRLAKARGVRLFVGSDAHAAWELGGDKGIKRVLKEADFNTKNVVNWTVKQANKFLAQRRRAI